MKTIVGSKRDATLLAEQVILSQDKKPLAVIVPIDRYNSLKETAEIVSDPELMVGILRADNDIKKGRTHLLMEVFDANGRVRSRNH